jgi:hypothetical protein
MCKAYKPKWQTLKGIEKARRYHLPNGSLIAVNKPAQICAHADNSHSIIDQNNTLHEIPSNWRIFSATVENSIQSENDITEIIYNQSEWTKVTSKKKLIYNYSDIKYTVHNPLKIAVGINGCHTVLDYSGTIHHMSCGFHKYTEV